MSRVSREAVDGAARNLRGKKDGRGDGEGFSQQRRFTDVEKYTQGKNVCVYISMCVCLGCVCL